VVHRLLVTVRRLEWLLEDQPNRPRQRLLERRISARVDEEVAFGERTPEVLAVFGGVVRVASDVPQGLVVIALRRDARPAL